MRKTPINKDIRSYYMCLHFLCTVRAGDSTIGLEMEYSGSEGAPAAGTRGDPSGFTSTRNKMKDSTSWPT